MIENKEEKVFSPTPMMLVNECARLFGQQMRKFADENGVPYGYRDILSYLAYIKSQGGEGVSQFELSKKTRLSPPTVSAALQKMERDGYITREIDTSDARQMCVFLTDKGYSIDMANKKKCDEIEKFCCSNLTDTEKENLKQTLEKIRDRLASDNVGLQCERKDSK